MAYVNVQDWDATTVAEWLIGLELEPSVSKNYSESFRNNNLDGQRLLHLTVSDLIKLNVERLGHQEIILEGLEKLKNLHYNLSTENLQYIALKLSCKAQSLYNEICLLEAKGETQNVAPGTNQRRQKVNTSTMSAVADILDALMNMLTWLDRPPFGPAIPDEKSIYTAIRQSYLSLGIELATNAQRDTFAENPVDVIKRCCLKLAEVSDTVITDVEDSLILQPSSLDIVTTKRRPGEDDFGLVFDHTHPGVHCISDVRFGSHAYQCGRIRAGDEIVQINYQTVAGWSHKKILEEISNTSSELILTLKKMPKTLAGCGRIYMQAFPIPATNRSAKKATTLQAKQNELFVPDTDAEQKMEVVIKKENTPEPPPPILVVDDDDLDDDLDNLDDDVYLPTTSSTKDISPTQSVRSLLMRPRSTPIRRATISAGSPSQHQPYINVSEIWAGIFDTTKSNKSNNSDGGSKQSSATSTMHSNDSGCATMYSSSMLCNNQTNSPTASPARPVTIVGTTADYINMAGEDYINLSTCKTSFAVGKRQPPPPPPPPKQPIPKPRLNVSASEEMKKKRPVPQPRSLASKSTPRLMSMTSEVHPVPSANVKVFKRYPSSMNDPPLPSPPPKSSSSSSSSGEEDLPPALPARRPSSTLSNSTAASKKSY